MNPEYKAKWVAALRSGEYTQTAGTLAKVENGQMCFCAMGVLADILVKEGRAIWAPTTIHLEMSDIGFVMAGERTVNILPDAADELVGYDDLDSRLVLANPHYDHEEAARIGEEEYEDETMETKTLRVSVMDLNDDHEMTFPQIADIIEAQL